MAQDYDVTTKDLVEVDPAAWVAFLGKRPDGPVEVLRPEVSTLTASADHVLHVKDVRSWLLHLEFQSSYDATLAERVRRYNMLLRDQYHLPVRSVVLLLHPRARVTNLTGRLVDRLPWERHPYLTFRYQVVRLWRRSVTDILTGELAMLPLAFLTETPPSRLPGVLRQIEARLRTEAEPDVARKLRAAGYGLAGLRWPQALVDQLFQGVREMRESSTFQAILEEGRKEGREQGLEQGQAIGRAEEARRWLLLLGEHRFGPPSAAVRAAIEAIDEVERLEALGLRLMRSGSWQELLAD